MNERRILGVVGCPEGVGPVMVPMRAHIHETGQHERETGQGVPDDFKTGQAAPLLVGNFMDEEGGTEEGEESSSRRCEIGQRVEWLPDTQPKGRPAQQRRQQKIEPIDGRLGPERRGKALPYLRSELPVRYLARKFVWGCHR